MIVKTKRTAVLKRVPPGDQWIPINEEGDEFIFTSLTEGINYIYKETKAREYHMSAESGIVYTVEELSQELDDEPTESIVRKYNIYGEIEK